MKKTLFTFAIGAIVSCAIFSIYSFKSTPDESKFMFLRTIETFNAMANAGIVITDGKQTIKTMELPTLRGKNYVEITKAIANEINTITTQGYKLVNSNSGGTEPLIVTNYIFEKQ